MGAVAAPNADPSPASHDTEPGAAPDSPRPPSSLCSSPGSIPPDSLQAFPGLDSPSIQCDSLECPPCSCRCRRSAGSAGGSEDSLQAPLARGSGTRCFGAHRASSDLSDSLESFIQHDSLQSLSSLGVSSSSISGDSLESLASLSLGTTSQHSDLEFIGQ
ncbi:hypothetical protein DUI87_27962 [Hirundo rustica rustica]|uniref:Uncharacterized protein n=1 Tax=Hirundo rustica rustica TaxID=333673 RepID=A0A3M0J4K4_HIRRU|nr:hypothetical protein DUI87_27962 [Hirundo rustica rustica]